MLRQSFEAACATSVVKRYKCDLACGAYACADLERDKSVINVSEWASEQVIHFRVYKRYVYLAQMTIRKMKNEL